MMSHHVVPIDCFTKNFLDLIRTFITSDASKRQFLTKCWSVLHHDDVPRVFRTGSNSSWHALAFYQICTANRSQRCKLHMQILMRFYLHLKQGACSQCSSCLKRPKVEQKTIAFPPLSIVARAGVSTHALGDGLKSGRYCITSSSCVRHSVCLDKWASGKNGRTCFKYARS